MKCRYEVKLWVNLLYYEMYVIYNEKSVFIEGVKISPINNLHKTVFFSLQNPSLGLIIGQLVVYVNIF